MRLIDRLFAAWSSDITGTHWLKYDNVEELFSKLTAKQRRGLASEVRYMGDTLSKLILRCKHEKLADSSADYEKCADCGAFRFADKRDEDCMRWGGPNWREWQI